MVKELAGIYDIQFSTVFSKMLKKSDISCYKIAKYTNIDVAYLSRLKNGLKYNPSPETILKISIAIGHLSEKIKIGDIEELFNSVGRSLNLR